jgi:DNA-binding CsgD family transcriptional regulator
MLLERDSELALLDAGIEAAAQRRGSLILVQGPAGIGKSELLALAGSRAKDSGFEVLAARGGEFERSFGFGIARQLLAATLDEAGATERSRLLEGPASLAAPALLLDASEGESQPSSPAMGDPAAPTQHGLHWLVANLAEDAPLVIAIDDLQWSDPESARWLVYLARRLSDLPVLVVAAIRTGELGLDPDLVAALEREPVTQTLQPKALSAGASTELVRTELGPDADEEFCAAAHRAAGGNPFFLRELIAAARAGEVPPTAESVSRIEELRPETVSHSVLVRLGRFPDAAAALTRAVAILGDGVPGRRAAALAELEPDEAAEAADALSEAAILAPGSRLSFAHPLIRAAVYADIPEGQRTLAHSRAAGLLAEEGATAEEVAAQLLRSEPGDSPGALSTLRRAAADALARAAPEAAIGYLRRAFLEPTAEGIRIPLLSELLLAAGLATDLSAFEGISDDPIEELTDDKEIEMALGPDMVAWLFLQGRLDEMSDLLERGIANYREAGDDAMALRTEFLALSVIDITPRNAVARLDSYADRLEPGTQETRAWFAMRGWWQHLMGGTAAESSDLVRRGIDHGELLEIHDLGPAFGQAILVLLRADQLDEAEGWIDRMVADARERSPAYMASALGLRSWLAHRRGDLRSAEVDARRTVDISREHRILLGVAINLRWLLDVLIDTGELEEAEAELASSGLNGPLPDFWWFSPLRLARARLRIAMGQTEEAIDDLRELLGYMDLTRPASDPTASTLALALHSLDREPEEVRRLLDRELEAAREWGTPRGIGVALRAKGLVESGDGGIELLRESAETLRTSPARLELARTLTALGSALRRGNRRSDAREVLREGMELAHRCGAMAIAERARDELRATGARPRRLMLTGVESLTPSERRVATMAAGGLGNREIAQDLFVSVKTVETHLGSAYRKLDISSRKELPGALQQPAEGPPDTQERSASSA